MSEGTASKIGGNADIERPVRPVRPDMDPAPRSMPRGCKSWVPGTRLVHGPAGGPDRVPGRMPECWRSRLHRHGRPGKRVSAMRGRSSRLEKNPRKFIPASPGGHIIGGVLLARGAVARRCEAGGGPASRGAPCLSFPIPRTPQRRGNEEGCLWTAARHGQTLNTRWRQHVAERPEAGAAAGRRPRHPTRCQASLPTTWPEGSALSQR